MGKDMIERWCITFEDKVIQSVMSDKVPRTLNASRGSPFWLSAVYVYIYVEIHVAAPNLTLGTRNKTGSRAFIYMLR
jgi:hypothetical protein